MLSINYLELRAVFLGLKEFQDLSPDKTRSNRQYNSACLHKQTVRHVVGPTVYPYFLNPDLMLQKIDNFQGPTYSIQAECGIGILARSNPSSV